MVLSEEGSLIFAFVEREEFSDLARSVARSVRTDVSTRDTAKAEKNRAVNTYAVRH